MSACVDSLTAGGQRTDSVTLQLGHRHTDGSELKLSVWFLTLGVRGSLRARPGVLVGIGVAGGQRFGNRRRGAIGRVGGPT